LAPRLTLVGGQQHVNRQCHEHVCETRAGFLLRHADLRFAKDRPGHSRRALLQNAMKSRSSRYREHHAARLSNTASSRSLRKH
jgi:hypothetical protein